MIWLALLPAAVGPLVDPLHGTSVSAADRELLPAGRHLGDLADAWWVEAVSLQQNSGGIATFDRLYLSAYGRDWASMRFLLNDIDITDPARPGSPLVEVPYDAWQSLRLRSLWAAQPGFAWTVEPAAGAHARSSLGSEVGGPALVPPGVLDRDPASRAGAPEERRALRAAREQVLSGGTAGEAASAWLFAEGIQHDRVYPTLVDPSGHLLLDKSWRASVLGMATLKWGDHPVTLLTLWQQDERSHAGAESRLPEPLTRRAQGRAWVGQARSEFHPGQARLEVGAGVGWRDDDEQLGSQEPVTADLEDQWLWTARPSAGERLQRARVDAQARLHLGEASTVEASVYYATLSSRPKLPGELVGMTYQRGDDVSHSLTIFEPAQRAEEWLRHGQGSWEGHLEVVDFHLSGMLGLDSTAVGMPGRTLLAFVSPAAGLTATRPLGGGELFVLLRRQPEALTAHAAAFLDPLRPAGYRYVWQDDGDLVPEAPEAGALLNRTGARYHARAAGLRRPFSQQFALGYSTAQFGPFRAVVSGAGRMLGDRFTVRYDDATLQQFSPVSFHDPGGDGRGEVRAPSGGQDLTVYARAPGGEGEETYLLGNTARPAWYLGAVTQLYTVAPAGWFLNLSATGYWSFSGGPFGSFPDRNDAGVLDEASADPNARVGQYGRPDSDRSFGINLMAGMLPWDGASLAGVLRYRDGEPFTRIVIDESLPQGPTAIMALRRGKVRHTFHMSMDARLRQTWQAGPFAAALVLDLYNLLGSGTEILEDPRTGPTYRRPLEMVPDRAGLLSLELDWR